jgi:FHA domain-containing protein
VKTVGIDLWGGQVRGVAENRCTVIHHAPRTARPLRELFVGAYAKFAAQCRAVDEPGVAIIAIDECTGRASGIVTLRARVARYVASIVGRHDQCDLFLTGSSELGLRQLAIVLDPVQSWSRDSTNVRYRVLDLRTQTGFIDEQGRTLRGLRCEGPALLRCAGYALFLLPLGDATDWPESAADAWAMIPERVYFDELECSPRGSMPAMRAAAPPAQLSTTHKSLIIRTHGPRDTGESLVPRGDHAGTLELSGKTHHGALTLGHDALQDGVLLGRYARCDGAGLLDDPSLSRVHALLLHVDDALLVIDTASRNGTRLSGQTDARVIVLSGDTELALGTSTRARWRWSQ